MRRLLPMLGIVAVLVAACGGGVHTSSPTTGTLPAPVPSTTTLVPSPTTTIADPSVVPAVITVAYVDAVFVKLDAVEGDAIRSIVAHGRITAASLGDLRAIYSTSQFQIELHALRQSLGPGLHDVKQPPGNQRIRVQRSVRTTQRCLLVQASTDFSAVDVTTVPQPLLGYYVLTRRAPAERSVNPTPWMISSIQVLRAGARPTDPC